MKLYQVAVSPNCQKVLSLARETGVAMDLLPVEVFKGGTRTPDMLAKNPNGKVPILEDDGFVLWESTAMLPYIAAKAGRADLAPTEMRARAEVDRWLAWQNAHFGPAVRKVAFERIVKKLANLGEPDEALVQQGIADFDVVSRVLNTCLEGKDYLTGQLSIADFAMVPYAALTESCGLDWSGRPYAKAWLDRMLARDSVRATLAAARAAA